MVKSPVPSVYNIPSTEPFLTVLAEAIVNGKFKAIEPLVQNPMALVGLRIYLPTRRAVNGLTEALITASAKNSLILPDIRSFGLLSGDYQSDILTSELDTLTRQKVIPNLHARQILAHLVIAWSKKMQTAGLRPGLPSSPDEAINLADSLLNLIEGLTIEEIPFDNLDHIVPDQLAEHWQVTAEFLTIIAKAWPAHLAENNLVDKTSQQIALIDGETRALASKGAPSAVIAAGSTGTIPATTRLLKAIANMANGAVVLPGLDVYSSNHDWQEINHSNSSFNASAWSHPQSGLKRLISAIGVEREEIICLGRQHRDNNQTERSGSEKTKLIIEIMRPAHTTNAWSKLSATWPLTRKQSALGSISWIEAENENEEALAIALILREALEKNHPVDKIAAGLITSDRMLARRVSSELKRWEIAIDDSAGEELLISSAGVIAHLIAICTLGEPDAGDWLSLLRYPEILANLSSEIMIQAISTLELAILRTPYSNITADMLFRRARDFINADTHRFYSSRLSLVTNEDKTALEQLIVNLEEALEPLLALKNNSYPLNTIAIAHRQVLDNLLGSSLERTSARKLLDSFLSDLTDYHHTPFTINSTHYPSTFTRLISGINCRAEPQFPIQIWGRLEARLQNANCLVLGAMNEGNWPHEPKESAFLSRGMQRAIGLEPPEKFISLAAHDFCQSLGAERVILTRALKQNGVPSVPSRFLQRLSTFAGQEVTNALKSRGRPYLNWARNLDIPTKVTPSKPPTPRPALHLRPRKLSLSDVETLIRDPYAIYAKHILKLSPSDPLGVTPDARHRGTALHKILAAFAQSWQGEYDQTASQELLAQGLKEFTRFDDFPELATIWHNRFTKIIAPYINWENLRNHDIADRYSEVAGQLSWASPAGTFTLNARADRIDIRKDGSAIILDFKTGTPPSDKQIASGLSPQLALEAAIALSGGFSIAIDIIFEMAFITIAGSQTPFSYQIRGQNKDFSPQKLAKDSLNKLKGLIGAYDNRQKPYLSRVRPVFMRYPGDYDQLARVQEWSLDANDTEQP